MVFSNSILPSEAGYYELDKASIQNGIMTLQAGGSAKYTISSRVLPSLTENFRVSILPVTAVSTYKPKLHVYISATTKDGKHYNYTMTPSENQGIVCTDIIEFEVAEYTKFTFTVYAIEATSLQLWELCPESSDSNTEVIIDGVKQSLPRLLFDYNLAPLSITQRAEAIGMIAFNLRDQTDLQGHLSISYTASEDCVLTLRVLDNYVTELYTPIIYDLKAGRGNITLPHAYLDRLAGNHATIVTAQVDTGSVAIYTRGLLYTIDGGYLAEREVDVGLSLLDFSIKQPEGSSSPTEVWIVGVDAGEALVRSREYSSDATGSFTARYSLGFAKDAAIEFDGYFALRDDKYTLYTDNEPYAFIVDNDNVLWRQLGSDKTTKVQIDTNVSSVSACRGYKSSIQPENDQGLIVLYVKNGEALYYNYTYVAAGTYIDEGSYVSDSEGVDEGTYLSEDTYMWSGPFNLGIDETVISATVHRLNDYRVGFAVTTATRNLWLISGRTYVNQAVKPDNLRAQYDYSYPIVVMSDVEYTREQPTVKQSTKNRQTVLLTFNRDIYAIDDLRPELFTVTDNSVDAVSIINSRTIQVLLSKEIGLGATLTYVIPDGNLRFIDSGGRVVMVDSFFVVIPGIDETEHLNVNYSNVTAKVSIRGIETIDAGNITNDVLSATYTNAIASVSIIAIETHDAGEITRDTLSAVYNSASASVSITQTGTQPI